MPCSRNEAVDKVLALCTLHRCGGLLPYEQRKKCKPCHNSTLVRVSWFMTWNNSTARTNWTKNEHEKTDINRARLCLFVFQSRLFALLNCFKPCQPGISRLLPHSAIHAHTDICFLAQPPYTDPYRQDCESFCHTVHGQNWQVCNDRPNYWFGVCNYNLEFGLY